MKFLLSVLFLILSVNILAADITVDSYLVKAGWEKQNDGWMDPETGIIWGPELNKMSWGEAKSYCQNLKLGGKNNWRLPTVDELQRSVCKVTGYLTRTACPRPRDHQKDLWLLNNDKGTTYWASDLVPGDPYNAYYFVFDVEGQQVLTSKGDKSKARCIAIGTTPKAQALTAAVIGEKKKIEEEEVAKKEHTFYIAPFIGLGYFFTNEIAVNNHAQINGELRAGYKMAPNFMLQGAVTSGLDVSGFSFPMMTNILVGGEYFILPERLSAFLNVGLGLLTTDSNFITPGSSGPRQTNAGFAWRLGGTLATIKWGDNGQYNMPISVAYSGLKTSRVLCHTVLMSVGFLYFN